MPPKRYFSKYQPKVSYTPPAAPESTTAARLGSPEKERTADTPLTPIASTSSTGGSSAATVSAVSTAPTVAPGFTAPAAPHAPSDPGSPKGSTGPPAPTYSHLMYNTYPQFPAYYAYPPPLHSYGAPAPYGPGAQPPTQYPPGPAYPPPPFPPRPPQGQPGEAPGAPPHTQPGQASEGGYSFSHIPPPQPGAMQNTQLGYPHHQAAMYSWAGQQAPASSAETPGHAPPGHAPGPPPPEANGNSTALPGHRGSWVFVPAGAPHPDAAITQHPWSAQPPLHNSLAQPAPSSAAPSTATSEDKDSEQAMAPASQAAGSRPAAPPLSSLARPPLPDNHPEIKETSPAAPTVVMPTNLPRNSPGNVINPSQNQQQQQQQQQSWQMKTKFQPKAAEGQIPASNGQHALDLAIQKVFAALRKEFPRLTDRLIAIIAPEMILTGASLPRKKHTGDRDLLVTWLWQTASALEKNQEWTHEVVREVLANAKRAFLLGERLPSYGGEFVEQATGGRRKQLPRISQDEAEAAIQQLLAHPELARPAQTGGRAAQARRPTLKTGHRVPMPQEALSFVEAGGLGELHKGALQDLAALLADNSGLAVSKDIDFGVIRMTNPAPLSGYGGSNQSSLPEVVASISGREAAWELTAQLNTGGLNQPSSRMRLRDISVTALGLPATIVDVRGYPELPSTFALVDDHGVCRDVHKLPGKGDSAVRLAPGDQYLATLILDTVDGAHRRAESGLMQQLVLITVMMQGFAAAPSAAWTLLKDKKTAVAVVGCRVSVALSKRAEDLQSLLNYESKPFIAERLLVLFDHGPTRYFAYPPPLQAMFQARNMVNSICWWQKEYSQDLKRPPPAHLNFGACLHLRKLPAVTRPSLGPDYSKAKPSQIERQICKYSRLLQLEEMAMEDQIRKHDRFSVRYQFAVFEPGSRPQYRLHDKLPSPTADFEALPLSKLPKKMYRGPQLSRLLCPELQYAGCPRQILLVLEVPGLPEDRPSLIFGDTVYVRFSSADYTEFGGSVIATESTRCMIAMPKQFYTCCVPAPRAKLANTAIQQVLAISFDSARAKTFDLVHVRFGFDRTRLQRMWVALNHALQSTAFNLMPPAQDSKEASVEEGLPSQDEVLVAAQGKASGRQTRPGLPSMPRVPLGLTVRKTAESMVEVGKQQLNSDQRWAVASFLEGAGADSPFTLFGPPGTGKTVTLVECALQVLKRKPDARLLLCAPQGYSADLLASALGQAGVTKEEMLRIADPRHPPVQMKEDVLLKFSAFDDQLRAFELPEPAMVASKRIIVMTCGAAGILRCGSYRQYHDTCKGGQTKSFEQQQQLCGLDFSHVLIDEAGQALLPEAMVPLSLLQPKDGKAMLCGDPKQLGPVVRSVHAAAGADGKGLAVSLLERFIEYNNACAPARRQRGLAPAGSTLSENYRSHSALLHIPNALFYDQQLIASADQTLLLPPRWSELEGEQKMLHSKRKTENAEASLKAATDNLARLDLKGEVADAASVDSLEDSHVSRNGYSGEAAGGEWEEEMEEEEEEEEEEVATNLPSTLFFGVRGEQMREGEAPSYFNPIEASALVDLLEGLLQQHNTSVGKPAVTQDDIGVIATYRKQVQKIRLLLRGRGLGGIRVGTVDDLQGQEERIIFISTVLSKPETLPPLAGGKDGDLHLGFWRNPKRFNVAITRAKALLVVLGHPMVLLEDPSWRELLRFCAARGAYRGAGAYAMAKLVRSGGLSSAQYPGLTDVLASEQPDEEHDTAMAAAVGQLAEMALLGAGHAAQMFPETLDESYAAYGDEVQWRIAL